MRLKDSFLSLIKGGIIGISSLIPTLSSGSVTYSLSIYENFLEGITNIFKKNNRKLYLIVIPILIGILAGFLGGVNLITNAYSKFPNQTIFLFVGLLFGGLRLNYRKSNIKVNIKNFILFVVFSIIIVTIYIILNKYLSISFTNNILLKLVFGLIIGITIIIPGIPVSSYTASLDKYNYINSLINFNSIASIVGFVLFITGLLIGIILISKIIYQLFSKYKSKVHFILMSFLVGSIFILIYNINSFQLSFSNIFTTLLAFLWGYLLAVNVEKENDR